jgi:hypothetical protein
VQLAIGDATDFTRLIALPDDRHPIAALGQMPVEAVVGNIERAILIPADVKVVEPIGHILDLAVRPDPVEAASNLAPECFRLAHATGVFGRVAPGIHPGPCRKSGRHRVQVRRVVHTVPSKKNSHLDRARAGVAWRVSVGLFPS